jgi:hypothetical protein
MRSFRQRIGRAPCIPRYGVSKSCNQRRDSHCASEIISRKKRFPGPTIGGGGALAFLGVRNVAPSKVLD